MNRLDFINESWIVEQLTRIKTLEREVGDGLQHVVPGSYADQSLSGLVAELNLRVDLLDYALDRYSAPALHPERLTNIATIAAGGASN